MYVPEERFHWSSLCYCWIQRTQRERQVSFPLGFTDWEFQCCMSNFNRWFYVYLFDVSVRLKPKLTNLSFPSIIDILFSKMKHSLDVWYSVFYVSRLSSAYKFRIQPNARNTKHLILVYDDLFRVIIPKTF